MALHLIQGAANDDYSELVFTRADYGDIYNHSSGGNGKNIAEDHLRFAPNVTHHANLHYHQNGTLPN